MLERISPINNVNKITKPMGIAHGEKDTRVPLGEALTMWDAVKKNGVVSELVVCEFEGHGKLCFLPLKSGGVDLVDSLRLISGFKQKSVIEYTNAAKVYFMERFLLS